MKLHLNFSCYFCCVYCRFRLLQRLPCTFSFLSFSIHCEVPQTSWALHPMPSVLGNPCPLGGQGVGLTAMPLYFHIADGNVPPVPEWAHVPETADQEELEPPLVRATRKGSEDRWADTSMSLPEGFSQCLTLILSFLLSHWSLLSVP